MFQIHCKLFIRDYLIVQYFEPIKFHKIFTMLKLLYLYIKSTKYTLNIFNEKDH